MVCSCIVHNKNVRSSLYPRCVSYPDFPLDFDDLVAVWTLDVFIFVIVVIAIKMLSQSCDLFAAMRAIDILAVAVRLVCRVGVSFHYTTPFPASLVAHYQPPGASNHTGSVLVERAQLLVSLG